jgi:hypothetical protein
MQYASVISFATILRFHLQLPEQLKVYFAQWKEVLHLKETLTLTSEARKPLTISLQDPCRALAAPPILQQPLQRQNITSGFLPPSMPSSAQSPSISVNEVVTSNQDLDVLDSLARRRAEDHSQGQQVIKKPRKRRTCRKCASETCPGSQRVDNCQNLCRDCQRADCVNKGRNPKKLNEPCWKGWAAPS